MTQLGMTLLDACSPVTKKDFMKWHSEGALLLLDAGIAVPEIVLSRLNDTNIDRHAQVKQLTRASVEGSDKKIVMFSNGVEEFVIVIGELVSDFTNRKRLTIYIVK